MAYGMLSVHYRNALRFILTLTMILGKSCQLIEVTYAGSHACV